jgi:plastocyanin
MKTTIAILVLLVVIIGATVIFNGKDKEVTPADMASTTLDASTTDMTGTTTTDEPAATTDEATPVIITYGANGFSPSTVTVKEGTTVTFKNESGHDMWVASGVHPAHSAYDGTTLSEHCNPANGETPFDECGTGDEYSFTFDKVGTWKYHNHVQASDFGTIVVQ